MSIDITEFIANFSGGARANKFRVTLGYPALVGTPDVRDYIMCRGASLPGSTIGVAQAAYQGRQIPFPGDATFEPWTVTVYNDESFSHRNAFIRWRDAFNTHRGNLQRTTNMKSLFATQQVQQLSRDERVLKSIKLFNSWVSEVSPIDLAYDDNDTIEIYTVTFQFSHWEDDQTN
jgi:hypothetical protein